LTPESTEAHLNLGNALTDQYSHEEAINEFSEAIRLAPRTAAAHYYKGRTFFDIGKKDEARAELGSAGRLSPGNAPVLYLLALVEKQANQIAQSVELLQKIIGLKPDDTDARYMLGQNLLQLGQREAAIEQWKSIVSKQPDHWPALYSLSRTLQEFTDPEAKVYEERLRQLQQSQGIAGQAELLAKLAQNAANRRDWPQAFAYLGEALRVCGQCPSLAELRKNMGLLYCRTGDLTKGEQELRAALGLEPNDPDALRAIQMVRSALERARRGS
jgi:tetratricopeptide (TPR) repeat protein